MKKISFLLVFVLIFAFFNLTFSSYELIANPINVVYAEQEGSGENKGQVGVSTTAKEDTSEESEQEQGEGLNLLGIQISGVWFWLAFAAGTFTVGFYVVKLIASYKKSDTNKD